MQNLANFGIENSLLRDEESREIKLCSTQVKSQV